MRITIYGPVLSTKNYYSVVPYAGLVLMLIFSPTNSSCAPRNRKDVWESPLVYNGCLAAVRLSQREFQITADDLPALLFFR